MSLYRGENSDRSSQLRLPVSWDFADSIGFGGGAADPDNDSHLEVRSTSKQGLEALEVCIRSTLEGEPFVPLEGAAPAKLPFCRNRLAPKIVTRPFLKQAANRRSRPRFSDSVRSSAGCKASASRRFQ